VSTNANQAKQLCPGRYGAISLGTNSTLNLNGGVYEVTRLNLADGARALNGRLFAISSPDATRIQRDTTDSGGTSPGARCSRSDPRRFRITLTQGLNRQIRRMCEALGYTVEALQRVRIVHIKLGELSLGRWRRLSTQEIAPLLPASSAEPARDPRRAAAPRSRRSGR
jgi:pseudouridine synthase